MELKMSEWRKGLDISVKGAAAAQQLRRFRKQLAEWGLAMPAVKPLVLDFGLGRFAETGLIEYWIANEEKAGYCGKYLFVFDGQTCPMHRHRNKHETFFIVQGRVRMRSGSRSWIMKPGDVFAVPRWKYHSFTGIGPALLLEVSTPCVISDNYFQNRQIPIGGNCKKESSCLG
jgi:D-lyxose ketol-isomerase